MSLLARSLLRTLCSKNAAERAHPRLGGVELAEVFDDTDENKLVYTELFNEFTNLIGARVRSVVPD